MCPSYLATAEEKDSTRGRARVLQDAVTGRLAGARLRRGRRGARPVPGLQGLRPRLPHRRGHGDVQGRGAAPPLPGQATAADPPHARPAAAAAGAQPRPAPCDGAAGGAARAGPRSPASTPAVGCRCRPRGPPRPDGATRPGAADVVVWVDTFTDRFSPQVLDAALGVLEAAGARPLVVADGRSCCGLTLFSTGQLDAAEASLRTMLERLERSRRGRPPGRGAGALLPGDAAPRRPRPAGGRVRSRRFRTLVEHLSTTGWAPPDLTGVEVVAQPHCHQVAVVGWEADEALLRRAGARVTRVGGCCGLAGDFGMDPGPLRRLGQGLRARPGPGAALGTRCRAAGRRLLLPHPGRRPGRCHRGAPGRAARRPAGPRF